MTLSRQLSSLIFGPNQALQVIIISCFPSSLPSLLIIRPSLLHSLLHCYYYINTYYYCNNVSIIIHYYICYYLIITHYYIFYYIIITYYYQVIITYYYCNNGSIITHYYEVYTSNNGSIIP